MEDNQSAIFSTYIDTDEKVWINLNHVVSARLITDLPEQLGLDPSITAVLRVTLITGETYDLINDMSEPYTRWADQFLFALNAFHGQ
jgi:hypothetical protein